MSWFYSWEALSNTNSSDQELIWFKNCYRVLHYVKHINENSLDLHFKHFNKASTSANVFDSIKHLFIFNWWFIYGIIDDEQKSLKKNV